jgi:hypothetical protein
MSSSRWISKPVAAFATIILLAAIVAAVVSHDRNGATPAPEPKPARPPATPPKADAAARNHRYGYGLVMDARTIEFRDIPWSTQWRWRLVSLCGRLWKVGAP